MRSTARFVLVAALSSATLSAVGSGSRLAEAIQSGDKAAVLALLKNPAEVKSADQDGTTPLHWAVRADDLETSRALLRAGADARAANRYGVTPLSLAAVNGNAAMIELLLAAGADANASVSRGQTVLMTAARTGSAAAVQALLARGADPNAREAQLGETALMWAASENHAEVVTLLASRGADVHARSSTVQFPKDRFGLEGVLTILPRGNWTPLMYAARDGAPDAARALARAGADVNAADPDGTTPLILRDHELALRHGECAARARRRSEHRRQGRDGGSLCCRGHELARRGVWVAAAEGQRQAVTDRFDSRA